MHQGVSVSMVADVSAVSVISYLWYFCQYHQYFDRFSFNFFDKWISTDEFQKICLMVILRVCKQFCGL